MASKRYKEAIDKARSRRAAVSEYSSQMRRLPEVRGRLDLPVEQPLPRRVTDTLGRLLAVVPQREGLNPEKELADMVRGIGQIQPSLSGGEETENQVALRKMMTRYGKGK